MNGKLSLLRTGLSALISLLAVGGSIWLLAQGIEPPLQFWLLGVLAVTGVIGADAIMAIREMAGNRVSPPTGGDK